MIKCFPTFVFFLFRELDSLVLNVLAHSMNCHSIYLIIQQDINYLKRNSWNLMGNCTAYWIFWSALQIACWKHWYNHNHTTVFPKMKIFLKDHLNSAQSLSANISPKTPSFQRENHPLLVHLHHCVLSFQKKKSIFLSVCHSPTATTTFTTTITPRTH